MCDLVGGVCTLIVAFLLLWEVVPWLYINMLGPKLFGPRIQLREMGQWALITGATDGIGKAFAKALAKKGLNMVLVSRSLTKLENVSKEIQSEYNVQTRIIAVDFTSGPEIYDTIAKQTADLEVGVLVNNVSIFFEYPENFLAFPDQLNLIDRMMACNVTSVLRMCTLLLPGMVKRQKGVVINVSSLSTHFPGSLVSLYAASKSFVSKFSEALATEYVRHGIIVQCLEPGPVATNLSKFTQTNLLVCTPETYVASALATVGIAQNCTGYFPHVMFLLGVKILHFLSPALCRFVFLKGQEKDRASLLREISKKNKN